VADEVRPLGPEVDEQEADVDGDAGDEQRLKQDALEHARSLAEG
jgi:hypothetical protein